MSIEDEIAAVQQRRADDRAADRAFRRAQGRAEDEERAVRQRLVEHYQVTGAGAESITTTPRLHEAPEKSSFIPARNALGATQRSIRDAGEKMAGIVNNANLTPQQRSEALDDVLKRGGALAQGKIQEAHDSLAKALRDAEAKRHAALTPPQSLAPQVAEARAVLRAMPPKERGELIDALTVQSGDDAQIMLYAVGGAPLFLSGAHEGQRTKCQKVIFGLREPELLTAFDDLDIVSEALDKMERGLAHAFASLASGPKRSGGGF